LDAMHALHLYIKPNILPRQARDKHRETTQKKRPAFHAPQSSSLRTVRRIISSAAWTFRDLKAWNRQDKPVFPPTFWIETIILPKQARDKHRENSPKKSTVFSQSEGVKPTCGTAKYVCEGAPGFNFFSPFFEAGANSSGYPYGAQSQDHAVAGGAHGDAIEMFSEAQLPVRQQRGTVFPPDFSYRNYILLILPRQTQDSHIN
jgi:hypothetical protein